jgi:hypothetical protein
MAHDTSYFDLKNSDPSRSAVFGLISSAAAIEGKALASSGQAVRVAILVRLWAKTPCPIQIRAPSVVSIMVRSQP